MQEGAIVDITLEGDLGLKQFKDNALLPGYAKPFGKHTGIAFTGKIDGVDKIISIERIKRQPYTRYAPERVL